jgi:hypothetical protein
VKIILAILAAGIPWLLVAVAPTFPLYAEACAGRTILADQTCLGYDVVFFLLVRAGEFVETHQGAITAVATVILAVFTWRLWWSTNKLWEESKNATKVAERAMVAGERAFVFAQNVSPFWERHDELGQYHWRFRPILENSGDTPTKGMTMYTRCGLFDAPLPIGFDFDATQTKCGVALIPPRTTTMGGLAPEPPQPAISPQEIVDVQAGKKFLYVWGWARYWDVFPNTERHITRFCWAITPIGDPFAYIPGKVPPELGGLGFPSIHHREGNCADDECA